MRHIAWLILLCLCLAACKPDPPVAVLPPPYTGILDLPETAYNYAELPLPDYFLADSIQELDNTPADNLTTDWGATLGRVLFYDPALSKNFSISCASCHAPSAGFSDTERFSIGFEGGRTGRNSMGLANARYYGNQAFFWDERAATLEDQVLMPVQDHVEMGMTLEEVMTRLNAEPYYPYLFERAFGDSTITERRTAQAMAQFVRSMVSYRAPYDEGRQQVNSHLDPFPNYTEEENLGKEVFFNAELGNCGSCHLPDIFSAADVFNIGLDEEYVDGGVGDLLGDDTQNGFFKVPSLRNVALTPPFMHDGRFSTLEEVVDFYNEKVAEHPYLSDEMRFWVPDGPPRPLFLSEEERAALVAFMKTLTDEEMVIDPRWSDPFL